MTNVPYLIFYKNERNIHLNKAAVALFPNGEVAIEWNSKYIVLSPVSQRENSRKISCSNRMCHVAAAELRNVLKIESMRFPIHKVKGQNKYCVKLSEGEVVVK